MFRHVAFAGLVLAAALVAALLEVQIEGAAGWAARLPTWKIENRWTRRLLGARPITGYHIYAHLLILVLLQAPFALGISAPTLKAELRILAFLVLFWVGEDFLWFVVNPAYGLRAFRRDRVPWHAATWWGFMPRDYWVFLPLGIALYVASL